MHNFFLSKYFHISWNKIWATSKTRTRSNSSSSCKQVFHHDIFGKKIFMFFQWVTDRNPVLPKMPEFRVLVMPYWQIQVDVIYRGFFFIFWYIPKVAGRTTQKSDFQVVVPYPSLAFFLHFTGIISGHGSLSTF